MKRLYFYTELTAEVRQEAERLGALLRDASAWHEADSVETCDETYGSPPGPYREKLVKPVKKKKAKRKS